LGASESRLKVPLPGFDVLEDGGTAQVEDILAHSAVAFPWPLAAGIDRSRG
jgi:hypothetical protein